MRIASLTWLIICPLMLWARVSALYANPLSTLEPRGVLASTGILRRGLVFHRPRTLVEPPQPLFNSEQRRIHDRIMNEGWDDLEALYGIARRTPGISREAWMARFRAWAHTYHPARFTDTIVLLLERERDRFRALGTAEGRSMAFLVEKVRQAFDESHPREMAHSQAFMNEHGAFRLIEP